MAEEYRINIMSDEPAAALQEQSSVPQIASVPERFIALLLDVGLVIFLYNFFLWLMLSILEPDMTVLYVLLCGVNVPFILYETIWSSGGRTTLGKKLVGIRVADKDTAEPLSIFRAFVRTLGYYISAVLLMCGFLLACIDDRRRALHDVFAGSVVVQSRPKSWVEKTVLSVVGIGLIVAFAWTVYAQLFSGGSWAQQRWVYRAQKHVEKIGYLEEVHYLHFGSYTNDLLRLSLLSGDPVQFQRDTQKVLHNKGFRIGISPQGYKIMARAKDAKNTPVFYSKLYK